MPKMKMNKLFSALVLAACLCFSGNIYASGSKVMESTGVSQQKRTIKGTIEDDLGPVTGASVVVKGTTNGTISDIDGNFSIEASEGETLVISFIGYITQEIKVANQTSLKIKFIEDSQALDEVVVTALGIKRESKKLGYAVSTIDASELVKTGAPNIATSLYGKAAGVRIQAAPGGATSSVSINIRGLNSISGTNQPLIVVDGVPVRNGDANQDGYWGEQRVQSNGLVDINAEDIADLSILKGASASALYGSEAANGVVLITTKSGSGSKGISVDFNVTYGFDKAAYLPEYQTTYGPGVRHEARTGDWLDGSGWQNVTYNGRDYVRPQYEATAQYGPRYDGRDVLYWDGSTRKYKAYKNGNGWNNLFRTGTNGIYNVAVSNGGEKSDTRFSYTFSDNKGLQRGSYSGKHNFDLSGSIKAHERVKVQYNAKYLRQDVTNRPYRFSRLTNNFGGMFTSFDDTKLLHDMTVTSLGYKNVFGNAETATPNESFLYDLGGKAVVDEYYWNTRKRRVKEDYNRFMGNATVTVNILEGLDLRAKVATDFTSEKIEKMEATEKPLAFGNSGHYGLENKRYEIYYGDLLLTYDRQLTDIWSIGATAGLTAREERVFNSSVGTNGGLSVENWFHLNASVSSQKNTGMKKVNFIKQAFFGIASIGYKNFAFLEGTVRHEKTSTLISGENTFTYPSVNASLLISEMLGDNNPEWLNYAKFRASYGIVGNAPDVYVANYAYEQSALNDYLYNKLPGDLPNSKLQPEKKHEMEFGLEAKMFNNRFGFEATFYKNVTKDQILKTSTSWTSGANSMWENVGELQNSGWEFMLYGTPIQTRDFEWDVRFNIGFNNNKINKLLDGNDFLSHREIDGGAISIQSTVGGKLGDLYAFVPLEIDGKPVVGENGQYIIDRTERQKVGNLMPDAVGGISNTFSYKNFFLDASIDFNIGGDVVNTPYQYLMTRGGIVQSMRGRGLENGGLQYYYSDPNDFTSAKIPGVSSTQTTYDDGVILPGVKQDGTPNDILVSTATHLQTYYGWGTDGGVSYKNAVQKNSYVKLRELSLGYTLPKELTSKFGCNRLMVSVYGRNLFYFYKSLKAFDAEAYDGTTWDSKAEIGGSTATTRSFGFSLRANF